MYVIDNQIDTLPISFASLTHMQRLTLAGNDFTVLPDVFMPMKHLTHLDVSRNMLTDVQALVTLPALRSLTLTNNALKALPPEMSQLTTLGDLNLENNRLTELPEALRHLSKLYFLHLCKNPLSIEEIEKINSWLPHCNVVAD